MVGRGLVWHPWPHTLVFSHFLPLYRALMQMCLPLLFQQDL